MSSFTDARSLIHYTIREFGRTHHIRSKIYNGDNLPSCRARDLRVSRLINNLWSINSRDWFTIQDQFWKTSQIFLVKNEEGSGRRVCKQVNLLPFYHQARQSVCPHNSSHYVAPSLLKSPKVPWSIWIIPYDLIKEMNMEKLPSPRSLLCPWRLSHKPIYIQSD